MTISIFQQECISAFYKKLSEKYFTVLPSIVENTEYILIYEDHIRIYPKRGLNYINIVKIDSPDVFFFGSGRVNVSFILPNGKALSMTYSVEVKTTTIETPVCQ